MSSDKIEEIYQKFRESSGSEQIATPLSLEVVVKNAGNSVLEFGAGIGTMTYAILSQTNAHVELYEHNDFCLQELKKNLKGFEDRYTIHTSYEELPNKRKYDLIVLDNTPKRHPSRESMLFVDYLIPKKIYFEGVRRRQRRLIRNILSFQYACSIKRNCTDGTYKGGTLMTFYKAPYLYKLFNKIWCDIKENTKTQFIFGTIKPHN